jgi:ankyrin repeat protein
VTRSVSNLFVSCFSQQWDRWNQLSAHLSPSEAKQHYITFANEQLPNDESSPSQQPTKSSSTHFVHVSTLATDEPAVTSSTQIQTPLDAVQLGDLAALKAMYERDPQLILSFRTEAEENGSSDGGVSVLHFASDAGNNDIVLWLIKTVGMDVNVCDGMGQTPLFYAIVCGQKDMIRLLTEMGALWDAEDNDGLTPKVLALEEGLEDMIPSC